MVENITTALTMEKLLENVLRIKKINSKPPQVQKINPKRTSLLKEMVKTLMMRTLGLHGSTIHRKSTQMEHFNAMRISVAFLLVSIAR